MNQPIPVSSKLHATGPRGTSRRFPFTAPLSRIPNELLSEIFKLSIPQPVTIPWAFNESDLPWALFGICKNWRHIVSGMPELWTNIDDDPSPYRDSGFTIDPRKLTRIAHKILLRSGRALLSLEIVITYQFDIDDRIPWINLITLHSDRIRCLNVTLFDEDFHELLTLPPLNFQYLEFLSLPRDVTGESQECSIFETAPLKVLKLGHCYERSPKIPCANLTHLSISWDSSLSPAGAHKILAWYPSLVYLRIPISLDRIPRNETNVFPHTTYPYLETLVVVIPRVNVLALAGFLEPLILPRLSRLDVISGMSPTPLVDSRLDDNCSPIFSIIPNFPQLSILNITVQIPDDYDMDPFFESFPNIVQLELSSITQSTLRLMYSGDRLPSLQILRVSVTPETLDMHLVMLRRRAENGFKTKGFLAWPDWKHYLEFEARDDEKRLIERLEEEGLLKLVPDLYGTYGRVREFIPSSLQPWH